MSRSINPLLLCLEHYLDILNVDLGGIFPKSHNLRTFKTQEKPCSTPKVIYQY